jgi:hypothetical protein
MIDIIAGLTTKLRQLKKRFDELDMTKAKPEEVKATADALAAVEALLLKEKEKKQKRQEAKEEAAKEAPAKEEPAKTVEAEEKVEDGKVVMPKDEFVEEHERIQEILEPVVKEKETQEKELERVKKAKFDIDDKVEPVRGSSGSKGRVMRYDRHVRHKETGKEGTVLSYE